MSIYALASLLAATLCVGLGLLAITASNRRKKETLLFAIVSILIGIWSSFPFITTILPSTVQQSLASRVIHVFAAFVPFVFWYLYYIVMDMHEAQDKHVLYAALVLSFPCALLSFSPLYIHGVFAAGNLRAISPGPLYWIFILYFGAIGSYGSYRMLFYYRRSAVGYRNRFKYLFLGFGSAYLGGLLHFIAALFKTEPIPHDFFIIAFVSLVAYAILRYRLMDISIIIRKTMVYSMVTGALATIYLVIVALFARLFQGLTGVQTIYSSAVAAGLITFLFQPLRKRIQTLVDSRFFRQFVDREEKLYELSRDIISHTTPEGMADALMRVLNDTFHPDMAALYLRARESDEFLRVSEGQHVPFPDRMNPNNVFANYFLDRPQPFVQDLPADMGEAKDTRSPNRKQGAL